MPKYKIRRFAPINITDPEGGVDLGKNLNKIFIPTKLAAGVPSCFIYGLLSITYSPLFWLSSKENKVQLNEK